jgi:DNA-binding SARP family transcriptional activator
MNQTGVAGRMRRIFRTKLLMPQFDDAVPRPRLLEGPRTRILLAQAPAGAGKTAFLTQWVAAREGTAVYYTMDEQDRDGAVFAAHVAAGLKACWPDWDLPAGVDEDPGTLAVELVNEAAGRPALTLVLDRMEAAFGEPYLADFLALLVRYAPPSLTLAVGTRSPVPAELGAPGRAMRAVTAADLAMRPGEAEAWLGSGDWQGCLEAAEGYPLALQLWREVGPGWRQALASHLVAELPPHVPPETGRALAEQWAAGRLAMAELARQLSQVAPALERVRNELGQIRLALLLGEVKGPKERLARLWDEARSSGDRGLTGAVALLFGETHYGLGEYGQSMEWYRQAFEADPAQETLGTHSLAAILKDLGQLEEAEALARRCLEARRADGDLQALTYALEQYGVVLLDQQRLDEAEAHLLEAEHVGLRLAGESFYGILAMAQRARVAMARGQAAEARRLAEEAYALARHRSPWLTAICGFILAPFLLPWREFEAAGRLVQEALQFLTAMDSKWQLHAVYGVTAMFEWNRGQIEAARHQIDRSLALASRYGYLQWYLGPGERILPLLTDALVRGVEVPLCQEVLVRMGAPALAALLKLAESDESEARRAVLYPLARMGGEAAVGSIRHLLYDPDERVRDGALVAMRSLGLRPERGADEAPPVEAPPTEAPAPAAAVAAAGDVDLVVQILGPVMVAAGGQPVTAWRTAKARDLLACLVLSGDRPVTRDQLVEALWPDTDLEGGQALLHTTLYYLRRALKPAGEGLITFAGGAYRLDRERVSLDLDRFYPLAAAGGEAAWREAVGLYRGELLEGLDYPWAEATRARARSVYLEVLRSLAGHLQASGRPGEAVEWLQRLIQADPLAEEGHVGLMACYAAIGNRNAALQQYRTLVKVLDEELGLEPGPAARDLYRKLLG